VRPFKFPRHLAQALRIDEIISMSDINSQSGCVEIDTDRDMKRDTDRNTETDRDRDTDRARTGA
jgi:hypothetical protein